MLQRLRLPLLGMMSIVLFCVTPVFAYKSQQRVPLSGYDKYFLATGSAKYTTIANEPKMADHEELVVEIRNVPIKPGTTLLVYVSEILVGKIKLDAARNGKLKVVASSRNFVPPISAGTFVEIKTIDGHQVLR